MTEVVPAVVPPAGHWYAGNAAATPEIIGYWQSRGWHEKDAPTIAFEASKAHQEAAKLIGIPPSELIRIPKAGDAAAQAAMWERLGAPKEAKDYDFANVKRKDGTLPPDDVIAPIREVAASLKLPKDHAPEIAKALVKILDNAEESRTADRTAALQTERADLDKNWGKNKEVNMVVAKNAARALGMSEVEVNALEGVVGYSRVMELLRNIGSKIGEDKFIKSDNPGAPGAMTKEMAADRIRELKADRDWGKRYLDGGQNSKEFRELSNLLQIAHA